MMNAHNELREQVHAMLRLLVEGKFEQLEALTKGVRLSAKEIGKAIREYGCKLILPPEEAFELMDIIESTAPGPQTWSVVMPLWTEEEGRSDLSLELTLIREKGESRVELDDIHVL